MVSKTNTLDLHVAQSFISMLCQNEKVILTPRVVARINLFQDNPM